MLGGGNEGVGEKGGAQSSVCVIAWDRLEQPDKKLMTVFAGLINTHVIKAPEI